ncbi:MAG: oligosaccharide flippase family protein [Bacteroidetes bacterium]|nr:oligosaccharide flippase family protein [Bacteroidota bacterium]
MGALTTKLLSSKPDEKEKNYKLVLIALLLTSLSIAVILLILKDSVANVFNVSNTTHIKFFACYLIFNTQGFLLEFFFCSKKNKSANYLCNYLRNNLFFVVAYSSFNNFGIETILTGLILLAVLRFITLIILVFSKNTDTISWADLTQFCSSSFPLLLSLLLSGSADYIDSFLAVNYFGQEQLAIFKYGAKELPLSLLMANALSNAMIPVLSGQNDFARSILELKKRTTHLIRIVFPVSIILMLTAQWIYPLVFSSKFKDSAIIFCIYLLLVCSRVMFPQTLLLAKGHFKKIAIASSIELVINIFASILLMRYYGIIGIAMATVIAFMCDKLILFYFVKSTLAIRPSNIIPFKEYLIFTFLLLASCYFVILY